MIEIARTFVHNQGISSTILSKNLKTIPMMYYSFIEKPYTPVEGNGDATNQEVPSSDFYRLGTHRSDDFYHLQFSSER